MSQGTEAKRHEVSCPWWTSLCDGIAETFRFTEAERCAFEENRTAQLIGSIPFAAGCDEPERTALVHLALYVTELRGGSVILGHRLADNTDLFKRLRFIGTFSGGNQEIIQHGMNWLALIMLMGYERSREADQRDKVYNPLNDGSWDAMALRTQLIEAIEAYPCTVLDRIFSEPSGFIPIW